MKWLDEIPNEIVSSNVVCSGDWLNTSVSPFPFVGRFFIKARTSKEVEAVCQQIINTYKVTLKTKNGVRCV